MRTIICIIWCLFVPSLPSSSSSGNYISCHRTLIILTAYHRRNMDNIHDTYNTHTHDQSFFFIIPPSMKVNVCFLCSLHMYIPRCTDYKAIIWLMFFFCSVLSYLAFYYTLFTITHDNKSSIEKKIIYQSMYFLDRCTFI